MFLSLDATALIQLINFAIFFALLNMVFFRPVSNAIAKRRAYINSLTTDYDRYQAEAKALRAQAEGVRADARRDAEHEIGKARAAASNEVAELSAGYNARVQSTIEDAQRTVNAELAAARANQDQLVSQLAGLMVDGALAESAK
jgi:F-type H+-transporting ATPase subunit b